MSRGPTYSDESLAAAVSASRSWRGVLRSLGLAATSSGAMRSVRRHADRLGLDYSHFTGQRRWTDDQLAAAVRDSKNWREVVAALGLADESSSTALKGHAARLGLDVEHLRVVAPPRESPRVMAVDLTKLPSAGSALAAAWFLLCGHEVSWPLEPCRYDLLVCMDGTVLRIQVKTTTVGSTGSWTVWLSSTRGERVTYDPDDIDFFFVIDGDLDYYLIPVRTVGGLHAISLPAYSEYKVGACQP